MGNAVIAPLSKLRSALLSSIYKLIPTKLPNYTLPQHQHTRKAELSKIFSLRFAFLFFKSLAVGCECSRLFLRQLFGSHKSIFCSAQSPTESHASARQAARAENEKNLFLFTKCERKINLNYDIYLLIEFRLRRVQRWSPRKSVVYKQLV